MSPLHKMAEGANNLLSTGPNMSPFTEIDPRAAAATRMYFRFAATYFFT